jgi:hypothetical protein
VSVHVLTAWAVLVALTAVAATAVVGLLTHRRRFLEDRLIIVALAVVLVAIATGALLVVGGSRPHDGLHLLYAAGAILVLPIARFAWPALGPGGRGWLLLAGCAIGAGLLLRLAQTG